jgi:hypothetical protein
MSSSSALPNNVAERSTVARVPLGPDAVEEWFDSDGRLVKEAVMRKALFEGKGAFTEEIAASWHHREVWSESMMLGCIIIII